MKSQAKQATYSACIAFNAPTFPHKGSSNHNAIRDNSADGLHGYQSQKM